MRTQWVLFAAGMLAAAVWAQEPGPEGAVIMRRDVQAMPGNIAYGPMGPMALDFVGAEMTLGGKPVKGAPYAGQAVSETTQTLSDGNRITRKSTASVYRDSEGRTRREETMRAIGPWAAGGEPPQMIFIHDPVAGVSYHLNPQTHVAYKIPMGKDAIFINRAVPGGASSKFFIRTAPGGAAGATIAATGGGPLAAKPDVKTESLGKQTIEGVEVEGTRSTITIAAGAIGNERPIETTSERWYSADLQVVVMSKRNDPRFGETTYQLSNIQRGEQPASLFEVPADYTVKDGPEMMHFHKQAGQAK